MSTPTAIPPGTGIGLVRNLTREQMNMEFARRLCGLVVADRRATGGTLGTYPSEEAMAADPGGTAASPLIDYMGTPAAVLPVLEKVTYWHAWSESSRVYGPGILVEVHDDHLPLCRLRGRDRPVSALAPTLTRAAAVALLIAAGCEDAW